MAEQTIIVPTNGVEGNITSCRIEDQVISIERNSVWSITERSHHISYDVCNKQIIKEWDYPQFTGGIFAWFAIALLLVWFITSMFNPRYF